MFRRAIAKVEVARLSLDRDGGGTEHFDETPARSPKCRRFYAGRRRRVFSYGLEHVSDKAVRCPVCETNPAPGFADTQEFGGGLVLIGREHHAEGGDDRVEGPVSEWQRFGVCLLEFDGQSFGRCPGATALQQAWHIIRRNDVTPAMRSRQAGIPVASGHVEDFLPRPKI